MDLTTLAKSQDDLMLELADAVDTFLAENPNATIQGIYFDQGTEQGEPARFRSTITFEDEKSSVTRTI